MVLMGPSGHCARCGEPFMRARLGRPGLYCGRTCRQRHHEERRAAAHMAVELHRYLLSAAYRHNLLLPLIQAARGDTSQTKKSSPRP